jgi:osmotically inducible protein OsmC
VLSEAQYSFATRFESGAGTNPEELIAAAHAGCFSMALSKQLEDAGMKADEIRTTAGVRLEKTDAGFTITKVHLDVTARIPGAIFDDAQGDDGEEGECDEDNYQLGSEGHGCHPLRRLRCETRGERRVTGRPV